MGVILVWAKYFGPKPPIKPLDTNRPAPTAPAIAGSSTPSSGTSQPTTNPGTVQAAPTPAANIAAKSDTQERTIVIENTQYRVEISNRGAVVKSWQLKKYMDDAKPPRVLDVVHTQAAEQTGGWPFAVVMQDPQLEAAANSGLYQSSSTVTSLNAPADLDLSWSNGHLEIIKHFHFDHSYVARVELEAKLDGKPITAG